MEKSPSLQLYADTIQKLTYNLVRYSVLSDRTCMDQLSITGAQGYTLLAIPDGACISMNDLSLRMRLASSTMTRMIDQLVLKGLVDRQVDAADRRVVRVCLTGQGGQAQKQLRETLKSFFSLVLQEIPEAEREPLARSLEMLNQAILSTLKSCCGADEVTRGPQKF